MPAILRPCLLPMLCCMVTALQAAEPSAPSVPSPPSPLEPEAPAPPPASTWEGALGLTASFRPEYSGASKQIVKVSPAIFLRYGRLTITNASGFVTRRADDVVRGLGVDLVSSPTLRLNMSLRYDRGRAESTSTALAGTGDIGTTVRVRTSASWRLTGPWRLGASWSVDALGRGGGNLGDLSLGWETALAPRTTLSVGTALSIAGDRYMQTYYGISDEQAQRSGYPVFTPKAGLRDIAVFTNIRHDIGTEWTALGSIGFSRLLGPAAASPLTGRTDSFSLGAGIARRF